MTTNPARPRLLSGTTLAWLGLAAAYLATRLANLTRMPLFIDEGTYLWWGRQLLLGDLSRGWGQGKPVSGWLIALPLALGANPVLATRLGTVLLGAIGLAATAYLAAWILSQRAALLTAAAWVLLPFTLFFERLATPDVQLGCLMMVALAGAWQVLHADRVRPWQASACGALWVLAALAKLPVSLFFFGLPAGIVLVAAPARGRIGRLNAVLLYLLPALFAAGVIAISAYRWHSGARPIGFGFDDILLKSAAGARAGSPLANNSAALVEWAGAYLGWPLAAAMLLAWVAAWFGPPLVRLLAGGAALWLAIFVSVAGYWVPRYVWPVLPMLVLILGWGAASLIDRLANRLSRLGQPAPAPWIPAALGLAVVVMAAGSTAPFVTTLLNNPASAPLPAIDRQGYVASFGSGYGLPEAASYLRGAIAPDAANWQVITLTISDEARLRAYLPARLWPHLRQVQIVGGQNQDSAQQIARLRAWLAEAGVTYVVDGSKTQWAGDWQSAFPLAVVVGQFPKPGAQDSALILRIATP